MARLNQYKVDDVIVEIYGPINGRNYNTAAAATPVAPTIVIQVFGTGSVQLEENQDFIFKGNEGPTTFTRDRIGDPAGWSALGAVVTAADGQVTVTPTVDNTFSSIRCLLKALGDGEVVMHTVWN